MGDEVGVPGILQVFGQLRQPHPVRQVPDQEGAPVRAQPLSARLDPDRTVEFRGK